MNPETEALWISLRDLALSQKAAVIAGNLDEAGVVGEKRRQLLLDIQKNDVSFDAQQSDALKSLVREILVIDEEAVKALKAGMQEASHELENINTFKVLFHGAVDGARSRGGDPAP